jgi:hypothetical protein
MLEKDLKMFAIMRKEYRKNQNKTSAINQKQVLRQLNGLDDSDTDFDEWDDEE